MDNRSPSSRVERMHRLLAGVDLLCGRQRLRMGRLNNLQKRLLGFDRTHFLPVSVSHPLGGGADHFSRQIHSPARPDRFDPHAGEVGGQCICRTISVSRHRFVHLPQQVHTWVFHIGLQGCGRFHGVFFGYGRNPGLYPAASQPRYDLSPIPPHIPMITHDRRNQNFRSMCTRSTQRVPRY